MNTKDSAATPPAITLHLPWHPRCNTVPSNIIKCCSLIILHKKSIDAYPAVNSREIRVGS